jgi:GT2 family glycosyltransferase
LLKGILKITIRDILNQCSQKEPRIKIKYLEKNLGIGGNSNEAISLCSGDYVIFLDHDDELAPFALYEIVKKINETPFLELIYSDKDKIDEKGKRKKPFFKPDWSPDLFLSVNYICHLTAIKKGLIDKVKGFKTEYEGAQDYDLFLRLVEIIEPENIGHIAKILYHWRDHSKSTASSYHAKPYAIDAGRKALNDALRRRGTKGTVYDGVYYGSYRAKYDILRNLKISINNSKEPETFLYYQKIKKDPRIRILNYNNPFNYSSINNYAVSGIQSEIIVLLNNDTEIITGEWLEAMLEHGQRREIGAVGAKLIYPDGKIQHAGVILGIKGRAGHSHRGYDGTDRGYFGRINLIGNFSAVTGACLMLRKEVFEEVGGFDDNLSDSLNDVDLCLKIREKGYLILYTPYAELYHYESITRGFEVTRESKMRHEKEILYIQKKWQTNFEKDPYYNPNLTREREDFSIK